MGLNESIDGKTDLIEDIEKWDGLRALKLKAHPHVRPEPSNTSKQSAQ